VKDRATMLAVLAVLSASLAVAEDFKLINGKIYKKRHDQSHRSGRDRA